MTAKGDKECTCQENFLLLFIIILLRIQKKCKIEPPCVFCCAASAQFVPGLSLLLFLYHCDSDSYCFSKWYNLL